ncbi:hypothetical protein OHQ88_33580 (plasmid) [Micromonospora zamorensis]|uniref:hypothetical protein n=1 Tax=Micromonospora zamorensis TaxID=709883 RepID=UPI002E21F341
MTANGEADGKRTRPDWHGRLAGMLLGAAGGMGINVLSNDVGYRGVAAAAAAGGVLSAIVWLRRLPPRAPLVRYTVRGLLAVALVGAVVATFGPASWAAYATLTAAALTVTAVLLAADGTEAAYMLLPGAVAMGAGVGGVGIGIEVLTTSSTPHELSAGGTLICMGVSTALLSFVPFSYDRRFPAGVFIGFGVSLIGIGITAALDSVNPAYAVAPIGVGLAIFCAGIAVMVKPQALRTVGGNVAYRAARLWYMVLGGAGVIIYSISHLVTDHDPIWAAGIGAGVMGIGFGLALRTPSTALFALATLASGVTLIVLGVALLPTSGIIGTAAMSLGVAGIGYGTSLLVRKFALTRRLQAWISALTHDPGVAEETATGSPHRCVRESSEN